MTQRLLCVFAITLLSGCGFSLRGSANLPDALQTMRVVSLDESSEMLREVQRALRNSKVTIVESDAPYRLGLGSETLSEKPLSVNANARAGEYELTISVMYMLSRNGAAELGPETLSLSRVYLADPESAGAKTEESLLLQTEMRRELSLQILRRLQSFTAP